MNTQLRNIKKALNETLDEKIARWEAVRERIDPLELPQFSIDPEARVDIFRCIELRFPYDPEIIDEIRETMISDGWNEYDLMQDHQVCKYSKGDLRVEIVFSINHEDSTCVKTKIGEREQIVSIYEISCKEGAEEKTFIHKEIEEK